MRKLVIHASRFAHSIVRLRRRLEWTIPSDYYPPLLHLYAVGQNSIFVGCLVSEVALKSGF